MKFLEKINQDKKLIIHGKLLISLKSNMAFSVVGEAVPH